MKYTILVVLIALFCLAQARTPKTKEEYLERISHPTIEHMVAVAMAYFDSEKITDHIGAETYDVIRTGVGCAAGGLGFVNTVFTDIDVISQAPKDINSYNRY
jgi:hypothetical protein